jgi:uncharacterized membrane protein
VCNRELCTVAPILEQDTRGLQQHTVGSISGVSQSYILRRQEHARINLIKKQSSGNFRMVNLVFLKVPAQLMEKIGVQTQLGGYD